MEKNSQVDYGNVTLQNAISICSVRTNSLQPHGLYPARLLCPWGFTRHEYWSGLPFLFPGALPDPGIKPGSPELQADSLLSESSGKPMLQTPVELFKVIVTNSKWGYGRWLSLSTNFLLNLTVYWIHLLFSVPFVNNTTMTINEWKCIN